MKILKLISNPYLLIASFLLLLISGESVGGFYITYIVLALPHGGLHGLLAVAGIIIIIFNYHTKTTFFLSFCLSTIGIILLICSLYFFFATDPSHYNAGTFEQALPLMTFGIFGFLILCSMLESFIKLTGSGEVRG
ncbi:MAG: hypothetical protein ABUT20_52035 [Bacteroidota bacterium]